MEAAKNGNIGNNNNNGSMGNMMNNGNMGNISDSTEVWLTKLNFSSQLIIIKNLPMFDGNCCKLSLSLSDDCRCFHKTMRGPSPSSQ